MIDEVSMLEAAFFDKLEAVGRLVRDCNRPFGGLQIILCGDFLQVLAISFSMIIRHANNTICKKASACCKRSRNAVLF